jgi:TPR repeat protein
MVGENLYKKALKEASKDDPNVTLILELLKKSIAKGNPRATYALGTWYLHGKYIEQDLKKAIDLITKASKNNVPEACFDLAVCYEKGKGIRQNEQKAFEYYLKAALYGDKQANYEVGRCYYYGIGILKNRKIGNIWLDKANSLGIK